MVKYFFLERIGLTPKAEPPSHNMLLPKVEPCISSRESSNCYRATRKRFFNPKEFSSNGGYLSISFHKSIMYDRTIKDLTISNSVCNSL
ncbi:hypothetical protein ES319_A06G129000v1 [Gossypium barbadense]|uniref:Uncharacterized protein n=1 Tax=Gossypium barbadense TaxID=3634 RepID=A0A5J5VDT2_GOSBA|nr:hypothetical protein ES319_A06G129000v1 [Gossypium barbadense]